jgi:hypothetical protein
MTSLICWAGIDQRGPASLYIASDSRLSKSASSWDYGRKVFGCRNSADIFGYCGAVLFPSQVLSQLVDAIDSGVLFDPNNTCPLTRLSIIEKRIEHSVATFPERTPFSIVYGTRQGEGFGAQFQVAVVSWDDVKGIQSRAITTPVRSDLILALGSGSPTIDEYQFKWRTSDVGRTSRAVFSAFCDAIQSGKDKYSGGAPQLVGLYLRGPSHSFGVFHKDACFLHGMKVSNTTFAGIEFRNSLFERCDLLGHPIGQRHARPKRSSS